MTILTDSARGCGQMKGKAMNNEQAALIAASQVVSGLVASGWFKTDVLSQIEKTTQKFKDRFVKMLPEVEPLEVKVALDDIEIECDFSDEETDKMLAEIIQGWQLSKEDPHKPD